MKKILIFASLFAAIASFGTSALAHAQVAPTTATASAPADQASLQQQLDVAKAELIQLETQAGEVPAGDNTLPAPAPAPTAPMTVTVMPAAPAMTLSATDVTDINATLTALANVLVSLQAKITQDPQFAVTQGPAIVSQLQGIGNSVVGIVSEVNGGNLAMASPSVPAPVASAPANSPATAQGSGSGSSATGNAGSIGSAANMAPAGTPAPATNPSPVAVAPSTPAVTAPSTPAAPSAPTTPAVTAPQTAQASSAFSFSKLNWPLIIVIVLIIAAIAIWLWWDDSDEKKPVVKNVSNSPKGTQVTTMSSQTNRTVVSTQQTPVPPPTPLSTAMGSQDQKKPA